MRWSMLPVSIAAHAAAFVACLVLPLAGALEAPTPWPLSNARTFMAAAPVPPPAIVRAAAAGVRRTAAPISAPPSIGKDPGPIEEPAGESLPEGPRFTSGVPHGLTENTFGPVLAVPPPSPPAAVAPQAYRPGGAIREPRKVHDAPAVYPEIARAARIEGVVILEATIDERGIVMDARVLRSIPLLDNAALTALRQWRYTPTLLNGVPVRVLMTVTFRFSLSDREL